MSIISRIKLLFADPDEYIFESDYRRTAAQLLRGQFDDIGADFDMSGLTKGSLAAMNDFQGIAKHFIEVGRSKERAEIHQRKMKQ